MKVLLLLAVSIVVCEAQVSQREYTDVLNTTNGDPWGTWHGASFCKEESWASGFTVKYEPNSGPIDDTAVNGIALICTNEQGIDTGIAEPFSGQFGKWRPASRCSGRGRLIGFQLQVEPPQGNGDDTGVNGVEFGCSTHNDTDPHSKFIVFKGLYGSWGNFTQCSDYTAICGIQTKVEAYGGFSVDDTSLDDIRIFCCTVPPSLHSLPVIG